MRVFLHSFFAALVVLLLAGRASAAYVPPPRTGFVTDPGNALASEGAARISQKLAAYQQCSTNEIAVFLTTSLEGNTIEDVAYVTFNTWKLGVAGKDNGVLLLIAPNERKAFIATGKGVGGEIPDITAFHILRDHVTPNMRVGKTFAAVDEGTSEIGKELGGCAMAEAAPAAPPPVSATALRIGRIAYGIGIFVLAFGMFSALRGKTVPKLLLSAVVVAIYEGVGLWLDPLDFGIGCVLFLLVLNTILWTRRMPRGSGSADAASAPWDSGGSYGGGSSGSSSSGGGGSTGGGGAGDSW